MSVLVLNVLSLNAILAKVLIQLLVASDGNAPQLVVVPLVANPLHTMRPKEHSVLLSALNTDKSSEPEQIVARLLLVGEASLSQAIHAVLVVGVLVNRVKILLQLRRLGKVRRLQSHQRDVLVPHFGLLLVRSLHRVICLAHACSGALNFFS